MKNWLRPLYAALLLALLYWAGVPPEILAVLAIVFAAFLLARERLWRRADKAVNSLGFAGKWPAWAKRALVIAVFVAILYALKLAFYFLLGLAGFDVQGELAKAFNATQ